MSRPPNNNRSGDGAIRFASFPRVNRDEVTALILGAGLGLRMAMGPKAFIRLKDATLLEMAVDAVTPFAAQIIVGVCRDDEARARDLVNRFQANATASSEIKVVVGGATRQETVAILAGHAKHLLVLLHEVARPHVTPQLFDDVLATAAESGGASLFLPLEARDSVATVRDGQMDIALPRNSVVTLQTPHAYRREWFVDAHERAAREAWKEEGTAGLMRRAGYPLKLVPGSPENVKLTYQVDLPDEAKPQPTKSEK